MAGGNSMTSGEAVIDVLVGGGEEVGGGIIRTLVTGDLELAGLMGLVGCNAL